MLTTTEHRVSAAAKPDHFTTAYKLLTVGYSVVPSGGGAKGKSPLVDWKEYQGRQPTESEFYGWQERLSPQLWGIVTGQLSGVVVFDADTVEMREELESTGLEAHINLSVTTIQFSDCLPTTIFTHGSSYPGKSERL